MLICSHLCTVLCSREIYDHQITWDTPLHGLMMLCPYMCPIQGLAGASGGNRVAGVEPNVLEMKMLFPIAPSSPSHMPQLCVSKLWDIFSTLRISNTFVDVKANVMEGPRGCSTILLMPVVQLSHFVLLSVDRNTREIPFWVENGVD